jgi:membrane protein
MAAYAEQVDMLDTAPPAPSSPPETALASSADRPGFSWHWCRTVVLGTVRESVSDRISLAAAGCAYYATLALFPAISMLVSVYGLAFDVLSVEQQLQLLVDLLPTPAFALIDERVHQLVTQPSGTLSVGFIVSFVLTFWSAATGTKSVLSALNIAYDTIEQRGILGFQLIALSMTLSAVAAAVTAIAVLVFLPAVISFVGLSGAGLINALGILFLIVLVGGTIALLYRYGPSRLPPPNQHIFPGALLATALWLSASFALSFYISHIASFGITYGSLGAVVAIMLWFYVSAYAALLGAELNAQLEQYVAPPVD